VTDTLALDAGFRFGSPAAVAQIVASFQSTLAATPQKLAPYFDQLDLQADDGDLIVSLAMSGGQLASLFAEVASGNAQGSLHLDVSVD
jgi:hypothetical protein